MNKRLSKKEEQVVRWIFLSNREIGDKLGNSDRTVEKLVSGLMEKFQASNRTELALKAREAGHEIDNELFLAREKPAAGRPVKLKVIPGGRLGE